LEEPFEAVITGIDEAGRGIGKMPSGKTFFTEGVFPGEKCLVREISSSSRFSVCEALSVIEPSPSRTEPFEPDRLLCGGLPLASLAYPSQLEFKASRVRECLERIGRFDKDLLDRVMQPIAACDPPMRYRNHMQYAISGGRVDCWHQARMSLLIMRAKRSSMRSFHCFAKHLKSALKGHRQIFSRALD
jgi:23S rRNA (uracil1939-C5)-methyltransferase